jgi:hypothetical protein
MSQTEHSEEQQRIFLLHELVGRYLAEGLTNQEIITKLQIEQVLEYEEAQTILRQVYTSWQVVKEGLDLQVEDERNWHQYLRMQLLAATLKEQNTPSRRLALAILDSLANIQSIGTSTPVTVPLPIMLIEKPPTEEEKEETGEHDVAR